MSVALFAYTPLVVQCFRIVLTPTTPSYSFSPFYILDEVDAALDATYRSSLAKLLHNMSHSGSGVQIIVSIWTHFSSICITRIKTHNSRNLLPTGNKFQARTCQHF